MPIPELSQSLARQIVGALAYERLSHDEKDALADLTREERNALYYDVWEPEPEAAAELFTSPVYLLERAVHGLRGDLVVTARFGEVGARLIVSSSERDHVTIGGFDHAGRHDGDIVVTEVHGSDESSRSFPAGEFDAVMLAREIDNALPSPAAV